MEHVMKLADDTPDEERIGGRDLTRWPTRAGALVRLVRSATKVSANSVLYLTASVGLNRRWVDCGGGWRLRRGGRTGRDLRPRPARPQRAIGLRTATNTKVLTWFTHLGGPVGMTIAPLITIAMVWRWRSGPADPDGLRRCRIARHDDHRQGRRGTGPAAAR